MICCSSGEIPEGRYWLLVARAKDLTTTETPLDSTSTDPVIAVATDEAQQPKVMADATYVLAKPMNQRRARVRGADPHPAPLHVVS